MKYVMLFGVGLILLSIGYTYVIMEPDPRMYLYLETEQRILFSVTCFVVGGALQGVVFVILYEKYKKLKGA